MNTLKEHQVNLGQPIAAYYSKETDHCDLVFENFTVSISTKAGLKEPQVQVWSGEDHFSNIMSNAEKEYWEPNGYKRLFKKKGVRT